MIENPPKQPKFILDLNDFDSNEKSLYLSVTAKNIKKIRDLQIENLWLIGANDKELAKILPLVNPKYLNLYQVLAKDLSILETMTESETIILNWNTKSTKLWDISKNINLRALEITDFSKLEDIYQLSEARQIENLKLGGGHNKALKLDTLQPLSALTNLKYLSLNNLKVSDDTLQPLGQLKNLLQLDISNQFETKEFAWLATRLKSTDCKMFKATNSCIINDAHNKIVWDTMVTGRKKQFLLSIRDQKKIERHIMEFEKLKNELTG